MKFIMSSRITVSIYSDKTTFREKLITKIKNKWVCGIERQQHHKQISQNLSKT